MIEDGSEDFRIEVCPDNARTADSLIPIIKEHVHPGSIIHTDMWRAYNSLSSHGYIHKKVNHSDPENPFVAEDGTHTQRIEASWRPIKSWMRNRHVPPEDFANHVVEYQWRREMKKSKTDPFQQLLDFIVNTYGRFV